MHTCTHMYDFLWTRNQKICNIIMQHTSRCISYWHTYKECHRRKAGNNKDTSSNRNSMVVVFDREWYLWISDVSSVLSSKFIGEESCWTMYYVHPVYQEFCTKSCHDYYYPWTHLHSGIVYRGVRVQNPILWNENLIREL